MKKILLNSIVLIVLVSACSKSSDNPDNNNDNSIQKQIVNTKWYYDSTVFWHKGDGFDDILDFNGVNQKSYIYFGEDSIMTEYLWTGLTYEKTDYPYVWDNGILKCEYDPFDDFHAIKIQNNQLIVGDVLTDPRKTDTTGEVELLWWYYHK
jgi:hypothetical protein